MSKRLLSLLFFAPSVAFAAPSGPVYWKLTSPLEKVLENQRCYVSTPAPTDTECGYTTCFAGEQPEAFFGVTFRGAGKLEIPPICDTQYRNVKWTLDGPTVKIVGEISSGLTIDRSSQVDRKKWVPVEETLPDLVAYGDGQATIVFSQRKPPNVAQRNCTVFPRSAGLVTWYCIPATSKADLEEVPIVANRWLDIADAGGGKLAVTKVGRMVAATFAKHLEAERAESVMLLAESEARPPTEGVEIAYSAKKMEKLVDKLAVGLQKSMPGAAVRRKYNAGNEENTKVLVLVGRGLKLE